MKATVVFNRSCIEPRETNEIEREMTFKQHGMLLLSCLALTSRLGLKFKYMCEYIKEKPKVKPNVFIQKLF